MQTAAAILLVFLGGFAVMVLEIIGARFLLKDFGGAFYVWTSQIGVVLVALSLGYWFGGRWADRFQRARFLTWLLVPSGLFTLAIPDFAPRLIDALVSRHPADADISLLWQKLDPALGSALVFLFPCFVLATLSPYMIRLLAAQLGNVGAVSGAVYAASTAGSVAGVFISGYVLLDHLGLSTIFRATGGLTLGLAGLCLWLDRALARKT